LARITFNGNGILEVNKLNELKLALPNVVYYIIEKVVN